MEQLERYSAEGKKDNRKRLRAVDLPKDLRKPVQMDVPEQIIHLLDRAARTWTGAELVLYEPIPEKKAYFEIPAAEFLRKAKQSVNDGNHYAQNLLVSFDYPEGVFDIGIAQFENVPQGSEVKIKLENGNKIYERAEEAYDWGIGMVYDGLAALDPARGYLTYVGLAFLHYPEKAEADFGNIAGQPSRPGNKADGEFYPLFGNHTILSNPKDGDEFRNNGFIDSLKSLRTSMYDYPWQRRRCASEE